MDLTMEDRERLQVGRNAQRKAPLTLGTQKWKTKAGEILLVGEMEDSHLLNTIRFIERNAPTYMERLALAMYAYAVDAPDGAAYAAECGADQLIEMSVAEFLESREDYQDMLQEACQRGLLML